MKEVKLREDTSSKIVYMDTIQNYELHDAIVCYIPKSHNACNPTGLGILIADPGGNRRYGFLYHKSLLMHTERSCTFTARSRVDALKKALQADRKVYIFSSFKEFCVFAAEHSAY